MLTTVTKKLTSYQLNGAQAFFKPNISSAGQEFSRILWNFRYDDYRISSFVPPSSQVNPLHSFPDYIFKNNL
jgi:hypothetical protein